MVSKNNQVGSGIYWYWYLVALNKMAIIGINSSPGGLLK